MVRALEEARFGHQGLLNLRDTLPTADEASARVNAWLRERQVLGLAEVMVITGRGKGSPGGIPLVREAVVRSLGALRRLGVIEGFAENGPGAFLVRLAPLRNLFDAPRRNRRRSTPPEPTLPPEELDGLSKATIERLRYLGELSLTSLGIQHSEPFVREEMLRKFTLLAAGLATDGGTNQEQQLRNAIERAVEEYENNG